MNEVILAAPAENAVAHIHVDAVLQHAVHNTTAENRAEPAADINHRRLCHTNPLFT